ncbi:unnamed protein product [Notodromas monacha]|uniref:SERRATE/Ars2 C-terminal domain-containing protein n=1 Tax=Notodromas monacha TaxID=399045 RepID=A0A7R9BQC2_9CRUS|nr:unnamed protein product [Notodromas monacha]CAG0918223.1 unnamed protein product [Notodromas monacha]
MKYHPVDSVKRKEEQSTALKMSPTYGSDHRLEVFKDLYYRKFMTNLTVDADMAEGLVRLLDTVVIKLEGGTDHDLKVLDQGPPPDTMVGPNKREGQTEEDALKAKAKALLSKGESSDPAKKDQDVPKKKRARTDNEDGSSSSGEDSGNEDEELVPPGMETKKVDEDGEGKDQEGEEEEKSDDVEEKSIVEPPVKKEPESESTEEARALHKTASIFLRSIHPSVTRAEIENLCTKYPGYLRCAIADPAPERRWFRRGWVTFERNTNVKEICWNLNNTRLKDVELGAILNRDLSRRIRTVSGLTCHKSVVRNDIRIAAKVVMALDDKAGLWKDEDEVEDAPKQTYGIQSKNPLMHNITEYMIEEASAEEDELVGAGGDVEKKSEDDGCDLERDEELITVLDRLILYLRIVHSVDFYNHSEYPNEDEMPNRCGIMHTRGIPPMTKLTQKELTDYMKNFETKMSPYMEIPALLTSDEAKKFGLKDVDEEIEKFVKANTQELAQDKWLCPLSGKKFRGPDFVRKHIFNKHEDKIEDVKREVEFFNNYVRDPRRPALPEHPSAGAGGGVGGGHLGSGAYGGNATVAALASAAASSPAVAAAMAAVVGGRHGGSPDMMPRYGFGGRDHGNGYGGRPGRDFSPRGGGRRGSGGFPGGRGRGRADPRAMVGYHDLDAPEELPDSAVWNVDGGFGGGGFGGRKRTYRDLDAPEEDTVY